jgi:hypothetical protein
MASEGSERRWRKPAIALALFLLVSLGIGPKIVDYYFSDAVDSVADQLGSVVIEATLLPEAGDPLFIQSWAFEEAVALGEPAPSRAEATAAVARDGVPVGGMTTRFLVRSNRAKDLQITQMRARVVRTAEPPAGTLVLPAGGGGPEPTPVVRARFEVDGPDPRARDGGDPNQLLFESTTLVLGRDESMVLEVTGTATRCYCEWVVDLELAIGDQVRTVSVPDERNPLRVTAPVPAYASVYGTPFEDDEQMTTINPSEACQGDCVRTPPPWSQG